MVGLKRIARLPIFDALRNRHYRWFWLGRIAASFSFNMGVVAQGWLVYELSGSALALALVNSGRGVGMLIFSLLGGAMSDRLEKLTIIQAARLIMVLNVLAVTILTALDMITVMHLGLSSVVAGATLGFMLPARKSYLAEMVGNETLLNAVSLTWVAIGFSSIVAPSVAGVMIDWVGVAPVFGLRTLTYGLALLTLMKLPRSTVHEQAAQEEPIWASLWQGLRYVANHRVLGLLLLLGLTRIVLAMPYRSLLPKYADDVLQLNAAGLGILTSAPGVGGLASAILMAGLGSKAARRWALAATVVASGAALVLFGVVQGFVLAALLLMIVGALINISSILNQTLMQTLSEDAFRGRVMSMYMMVMGMGPTGTLPAGYMADQVGVPLTLILFGGLCAVAGAITWGLGLRSLRRRERAGRNCTARKSVQGP